VNDSPVFSRLDPAAEQRVPRWPLGALAGLVVLGLWLRASQVGESLWLDELHTSWVVSGRADEVAPRARMGNQSPLYFGLVWCTVRWLGHDEWTLRFVSLVAGTGLMVAVFGVVWRWTYSPASALLAAGLVAVERHGVFYAQEARPYALLQLSAVLHVALLVEMWNRPTRLRRVAWVLGAVWMFYLHYTSCLLLAAEVGCLLWHLIWYGGTAATRPAYRWRWCMLDAAAVLVLLLPAAGHLRQLAAVRGNWERFVRPWPLPGQELLLVFVALPLAGLAAAHWLRLPDGRFRWRSFAGRWTIAWWSLPPLLAVAGTWTGLAALALLRYVVASLPGVLVFAALNHARYASRWYRRIMSCLLVAGTLATGGMIDQLRRDGRWVGDRAEQWDALVDELNVAWDADPLPVLVCAGLVEDAALQWRDDHALGEYCLFPLRALYACHAAPLAPLPTGRDVRLSPRIRRLVSQRGGAWLVVRARPTTAGEIAAGVAAQVAAQAHTVGTFGNIMLVHLLPVEQPEPGPEGSPAPR
jgi:hypothetical protein